MSCGGQHYLPHAIAQINYERTDSTCKGRCTATKFQKDFATLCVLLVKLESADRQIICCALLDSESQTALIWSDELSWLGYRQKRVPLTIKIFSGAAKTSSVSSAFPALPMDESEAVNIESAMVVTEPPIMRPTIGLSERIRHWPQLVGISIKEIEVEVLVVIG